MSITVTINHQNFNLDDKQVAALRKVLGLNGKTLSEVAIGDTFKVADIEFIKFTEENGETIAVAKNVLFNAVFDNNSNNFAKSKLLKKLETETLPKIETAVGADNVLHFVTDLTSLDGLDDYGKMTSKISLPTFDFYRKHVKIFDKHNPNEWWWLSTPDSTPTHGARCYVRCVNLSGTLGYYDCSFNCGVRPVLGESQKE